MRGHGVLQYNNHGKGVEMMIDYQVPTALLNLRDKINESFSTFVGPIGPEICQDEFDRWYQDKHGHAPTFVNYIERLAAYIQDRTARRSFLTNASQELRRFRSTR